jgi:hypothetical protein
MLKDRRFHALASHTLRLGDRSKRLCGEKRTGCFARVLTCGVLREKGYAFADFQDVFARYLGPNPSAEILGEAKLIETPPSESDGDG